MKILYIDSADSINNIRIAEKAVFCNHVLNAGHSVDVLLLKPKHEEIKLLDQSKINVYYYTNNFLSRLYINIPLIISLIKIKCLASYDHIICRNIISISLVPLVFAKFLKIKFTYIKAFPTDLSHLHKSKTSKSFLKRKLFFIRYLFHYCFDLLILKISDKIITRTTSYSDYIKKRYFLTKDNIFSLPMGFDSSYFLDINMKNQKPIDIDPNKRYIGYFGSIAAERNIGFILEVISSIIKKYPNVYVLIIGANASEFKSVLFEATRIGINNNVLIKGELDRYELYSYLKYVEFTISAIPVIDMYKISSPTKVVESLGLGIPVVANNEIFDQNSLVTESNGGISVPYTHNSFVEAIFILLELDKRLLEKKGNDASEYIQKNRNYNILTDHVLKFLS